MHAKHSAHPHAGECQPLGYSFQLMNNSATFLMFNSVSEKLLTHALCQLPIAFITPFYRRFESKVMLHVRSAIITKQLGQQWEFLPALSAGLLESCYGLCKSACVRFHTCVDSRRKCPVESYFFFLKSSILKLNDSASICLHGCMSVCMCHVQLCGCSHGDTANV